MKYRIVIGIDARMAPAISCPQMYWSPTTIIDSLIGTVIVVWSEVKTSARRNSFQDRVNEKIAEATIPGAESGNRIRNSAPILVQPSTIACSSSSGGMARKYPMSIQVQNGTVIDRYVSISDFSVLPSPSATTIA